MSEWQPIETAPKHEEVLVWRADAGVMLSIYTSCADQGWPSEKEMDEMDEDTLWQMDWWWFGPHGACRMDGSEVPTLWMPMPDEPKDPPMTLLHQAAQKAVKLPRHNFWGAGEPDCPPELKAPNGELHTMRCKVCGDGWRKSSDVCLSALQQQPEPVAMRDSVEHYGLIDDRSPQGQAQLAALQHQEVPREPVAHYEQMRLTLIGQVHELLDIAERHAWTKGPEEKRRTEGAIAHARKVTAPYNYNGAVSPSTTRQQEVGSGLLDNETFRKGIREDGTVEGYYVETYYLPCKAIGDDNGFMRVVVDDNATDAETRVPHSALISSGWVRAAAPSTPENAGGGKEAGEAEPTIREQTLAGLVKRLAWLAPKDHAARIAATECLQRYGYLSPLRADVSGVGAVVSQTPPPLGTDGGTPQ